MTIADLCCGQNWKWELISFDLPQPIKEKIKVVPIQLHGSGREIVLWKFSKNGEFIVSSAYRLANQGEELATPFHGQWIWKLDILLRIICFLWLCLHGSVPVKEVLTVRGVNCDKVSPLCRDQDETIVHLLRECVFACNLWRKLEVPPSLVNSFTDNVEVWLKHNCLSEVRHKGSIPWCFLFLLLFGICGKTRIKLCLKTLFQTPCLIRCVSAKLRSIFTV